MHESDDVAKQEQWVRYWSGLRNISYQKYSSLEPQTQEVLRNHVYGTHRASYGQLQTIDEKLRSSDIIMGRNIDQNDLRSPEALERFYSLTKDEIHTHLSKF